MKLLLGRGVTVNRMRHELLYAAQATNANTSARSRSATTIPRPTFLEVLDHECDPGQKLEARRLDQIADLFADRNGAIEFEAFLSALASTIAMASTMAYLFGQISVLCSTQAPDATAVLNQALRKGSGPSVARVGELKPVELQTALSGLQIYLSRDEEALLLLEYDVQGDGRYFDLAALEEDFQEWKSKEYHERHRKHRHDLYGQCAEPHGHDDHGGNAYGPGPDNKMGGIHDAATRRDEFGRSHPSRPGLRPEWQDAVHKYGYELRSIVDGMASRHSGALAWLRHHCQGSTIRRSEFERAIQALGIREGEWTVPAGRLFEALLPRGAESMPLADLDDLLKHI